MIMNPITNKKIINKITTNKIMNKIERKTLMNMMEKIKIMNKMDKKKMRNTIIKKKMMNIVVKKIMMNNMVKMKIINMKKTNLLIIMINHKCKIFIIMFIIINIWIMNSNQVKKQIMKFKMMKVNRILKKIDKNKLKLKNNTNYQLIPLNPMNNKIKI